MTDRRVMRTRKLLRDALMGLILEKGYDGITVQEITDRANLGRATLYLHYKGGKEELLVSSLQEGMNDLIAIVESQGLIKMNANHEGAFVLAFRHAAAQADLYRVLFSGQGAAAILIKIHDHIATITQDAIEGLPAIRDSPFPLDVASNYLAGSLLMMLEWWLRNDMPYSPEEMASMFATLTLPGMMNAFGRGEKVERSGLE